MQKFSNISGEKVNSEPKVIEVSKEQIELETFKQSILNILSETLVVRNEGSYKHAMIVSQIDGKEMFVEALMDFLSEKENNKAISYLESLKKSNKDWKSIDEKIEEIKAKNEVTKYLLENNTHVESIKTFIDKYASSEDFSEILETHLLKISDYNTAFTKAKIANLMLESEKYTKYPKGRIKTMAVKFTFRANQLKK